MNQSESKPTESASSKGVVSQPSGVTPTSKPCESSKPHWNPHPYQRRAISLLLSQSSAGLFLDPGLGKTSIVLAAIKLLKQRGFFRRALVIAPLRPMQKVWPDEIKKWEDFKDLTWTILHGARKLDALTAKTDIHLINPEGLAWLTKQGAMGQYDVLVVDESSKFKDSQTVRFKSLKHFLPSFKRRWILTGTPVPNGLEDLFGQVYILDLGRSLGRYVSHFRREFFHQATWSQYVLIPNEGSFERVITGISPLILQLSAEDYLAMPEMVLRNVEVTLPPPAMKIYRDVEDSLISEMESGHLVAANAAVAGVKCRQIANGAVYRDDLSVTNIHDEKLDALEDLLEELGGESVLVMYEFDHDKERILKRFPDMQVFSAGMSSKKLNDLVDGFNAGGVRKVLGHPASMGHGLNLQGKCRYIIWYGITWNLEYYDQAIARIYRQGQKSDRVFVYHIVARDTLDQVVLKRLQHKDKEQFSLLSALSTYRQEHLERA